MQCADWIRPKEEQLLYGARARRLARHERLTGPDVEPVYLSSTCCPRSMRAIMDDNAQVERRSTAVALAQRLFADNLIVSVTNDDRFDDNRCDGSIFFMYL